MPPDGAERSHPGAGQRRQPAGAAGGGLLVTSAVRAPVPGFHAAVSAIVVERGRVLMVLRTQTREWAPGRWDLPGGHIEPGENERQALLREVSEELGAELTLGAASLAGRLVGPNYDVACYHVRAWTGTPRNAAPREHSQLRWMGERELAQAALADPAILPIVRSALSLHRRL